MRPPGFRSAAGARRGGERDEGGGHEDEASELHARRVEPVCEESIRAGLPPGTLSDMSSTVGGTFEKVLRFGEGRRLKRLQQQAAYIATLEPEFQALSDDELRAKTAEFKERHENGESLDELLFEAFAAVREARWRESQQRMFDVQMMGGIVLHEGDIAEMKTGEGKTFVASRAALPERARRRPASTSSPSTTTSPSATPNGTAASSTGSG